MNEEKVIQEVQNLSAERISDLISSGISWGVEVGKSILLAVLIYIVGKFVINIINKLLARMLERRNVDASIQSFVKSFVNILLTILVLISVVSALGVDTTSFAALLASAGVAAGMALSGNLQNLAGGLIILLFKPYKVGDYIEAQGTAGSVKEIQILHTILVTPDNRQIYVPNGALSSGSVTNYSSHERRRVDLTIGVEYGEDINKVREVLQNLINKDARILKDGANQILLGALADSSVNIVVRVWVESANYWDVFFGLTEDIYNEFNAQGIGFPFPHLTINQAK